MVEGNQPVAPNAGWLRPLVAIVAFVVVLTVASTAAVLWVGGPRPASYPAGSPQAAFQDFVTAVQNGDWATADGMLSSNQRAQGVTSQMVGGMFSDSGATVSIVSSSGSGDRVTLNVTVQVNSGSWLGSYSYTNATQVVMVQETGGWKVDSQLYGK